MQGAIRSLLAACDRVVVFEGPAGEPLEAAVPPSDFSPWWDGWAPQATIYNPAFTRGKWSTDAKKRTAMIESLRPFTEPTWGVWVDGDEVLCNPEYLRDWLNFADWKEEESGVKNLGWPLKLVEMDGSIAVCQAKVLRVDRIDGYSVSSSVFRDALGQLHGRGNYRATIDEFGTGHHLRQLGEENGGYLFAWPPLPCESFIMHRSKLRHPKRTGLRMHEQEADEIAKAKAEGLGEENGPVFEDFAKYKAQKK